MTDGRNESVLITGASHRHELIRSAGFDYLCVTRHHAMTMTFMSKRMHEKFK